MKVKIGLTAEFALLFFVVPAVFLFDSKIIHPSAVLLPVLIVIFLILKYKTGFQFKELTIFSISRKILFRHFLIQIGVFLSLLAFVLIFHPDKLFNLPRANPLVWILLSVFYPVFSAYAQEIIFRTFLYRRYHMLFDKSWKFILASAVAFSYVHIVYFSPLSIILSFLGGLYLAAAYLQTRSVLFTSVLHGLMGDMVFGIGLGQFFWLDMLDYI